MKLENLSSKAQDGLRMWAVDVHNDDLLFDGIAGNSESWAWMVFQLRESKDRPEWFPKGKWATVQMIEMFLREEAQLAVGKWRA